MNGPHPQPLSHLMGEGGVGLCSFKVEWVGGSEGDSVGETPTGATWTVALPERPGCNRLRDQTFGLFGLEGHGAGAVTCFLRWLQLVAQNGSRREAC